MAAPTLLGEYDSGATNTGTATLTVPSITVAVGDLLVAWCSSVNPNWTPATTLSGGSGFTWTLQNSQIWASHSNGRIWTAVATAAQTFTLTSTWSGSATGVGQSNMMDVWRWAPGSTVGAVTSLGGAGSAPSMSITTTADNSAICVGNADDIGVNGTTRTWRTTSGAFTETYYNPQSSGAYGLFYAGYHADAGTAGVKTVGMTAPTGQSSAMTALEVVGASATASPLPAIRAVQRVARIRSAHF